MVLVGLAVTPAALVAVSRSCIAPSPRPRLPSEALVSTAPGTLCCGHCCHVCRFGAVSGVGVRIAGRLPNTTAAPHTPDGSLAVNATGQPPRTQPPWYQRLSPPLAMIVGA